MDPAITTEEQQSGQMDPTDAETSDRREDKTSISELEKPEEFDVGSETSKGLGDDEKSVGPQSQEESKEHSECTQMDVEGKSSPTDPSSVSKQDVQDVEGKSSPKDPSSVSKQDVQVDADGSKDSANKSGTQKGDEPVAKVSDVQGGTAVLHNTQGEIQDQTLDQSSQSKAEMKQTDSGEEPMETEPCDENKGPTAADGASNDKNTEGECVDQGKVSTVEGETREQTASLKSNVNLNQEKETINTSDSTDLDELSQKENIATTSESDNSRLNEGDAANNSGDNDLNKDQMMEEDQADSTVVMENGGEDGTKEEEEGGDELHPGKRKRVEEDEEKVAEETAAADDDKTEDDSKKPAEEDANKVVER